MSENENPPPGVRDGEEFGTERLKALLHQSNGFSAAQIAQRIVEAVEEHTRLDSQADDITILVVRATNPPTSARRS